ncbi:hypothetical protein NMY22_g14858 [Coprinellus aureogranulatus]|nr:hypothetical protein NMY22_g14858 [Coprinellus aureogranulatus]
MSPPRTSHRLRILLIAATSIPVLIIASSFDLSSYLLFPLFSISLTTLKFAPSFKTTSPTTTQIAIATLNDQPVTRVSDKAARRAKLEAFVEAREELVGHMRDEGMPVEAVE